MGILNAIAGRRLGFVESIVVGIGETVASITDESLVFEVSGADMTTAIVDPVNEKVYFKTVLPIDDQYIVYEIGCFPNKILAARSAGSISSALLINFNSQTRWYDTTGSHTLGTTNNRLDVNSIQYSISGSATAKGYALVDLDLSYLPDETQFSFAYYASNLSDLIIRFKTDDSNYYSYNSLSVTNGYHISPFAKADFSTTGTPSWNDINSVEVEAIATASPGVVSLDGLRYDLTTGVNNDLLSRAVLTTPVVKMAGVTMDIEYVLDLDL